MSDIIKLRQSIRRVHLSGEKEFLAEMAESVLLPENQRKQACERAKQLIEQIRADKKPALLDVFLAEYGLSSSEGVALMCMAEALMRVPDNTNIDELIDDKITTANWDSHKGNSDSVLVNSSTIGLIMTRRILEEDEGMSSSIKGLVRKLGKPVIRSAVKRAMKELGNQFVLGETIEAAVERGKKKVKQGYSFSYDMLGEAALTRGDAERFFNAYSIAIAHLATQVESDNVISNPGISIKLSALHPRYEASQRERVMKELVRSTLQLASRARQANIGLNIDAEEAERLELSLDVIEAVLKDKSLQGWDGFGVVVQAYSKRAPLVLDWLQAIAVKYDRKMMVRLVKGAYWDTEIKRSQVEGLSDFPVFTQKSATDACYLCCAQRLFTQCDRLYPQFATHNANTIAAVLEMAGDKPFELQRLHGMGEALHRIVKQKENVLCRIYAPVGPHKELLAYLVRRLLENGANSSFVNQVVDKSIASSDIAETPFHKILNNQARTQSHVVMPKDLFGENRENSTGWDLNDENDIKRIEVARNPFIYEKWHVKPLTAIDVTSTQIKPISNPAVPADTVGFVTGVTQQHLPAIINASNSWECTPRFVRSQVLGKAAQLFEKDYGELFAALSREAGKTPADAIAELREAVDFLRYYALENEKVADRKPCGVFACISPWNFPLAIFTGQIAAALAAGNGVIAKPAEQTPVSAWLAVKLLHRAGVPKDVLQLVPGKGSVVGSALASSAKINGMCFTGSTATAQRIHKNMAKHLSPKSPLIAETGGLNAMIVDSTALPEQVVKDVIASAFQSAGQRCSALRVLYLQKDIADKLQQMLVDAMDELVVGNPWSLNTDVGPVIDIEAARGINEHLNKARQEGRLIKQLAAPKAGTFVGPAVIRIPGIADLKEEIFGPVLHIATFDIDNLDSVIADINATGYGLTFGLHTRINSRIDKICRSMKVGNIYVNRNQIGAIVGSQPFGGEGLSGTGPKAGGPNYIKRFTTEETVNYPVDKSRPATVETVQHALNALPAVNNDPLSAVTMGGPTGESNVLSFYGFGVILCLGPNRKQALEQASIARANGCTPLVVVPNLHQGEGVNGFLERDKLTYLRGFDSVVCWGNEKDLSDIRVALANREGVLIPLITSQKYMAERCIKERHVCIDTAAAGGNTELLASATYQG